MSSGWQRLEDRTLLADYSFANLASFNGANGSSPYGGVIADASGNLFGTTFYGGPFNDGTNYGLTSTAGTIFEVVAGSDTVTTLASFDFFTTGGHPSYLVLDPQGNLFGATPFGGSQGSGTVFELAKGSHTITVLKDFSGTGYKANPWITLDAQGNIYGTAGSPAQDSSGMVYEIAKGSGRLTKLADFGPAGPGGLDGYGGEGLVLDAAGNLYGLTTAINDGRGLGGVYEVAKGSGRVTILDLFSFDKGYGPESNLLIDAQGNLYGTTQDSGPYDAEAGGTVFEVPATTRQITTLARLDGADLGLGPSGRLAMDAQGNLFGSTRNYGISSSDNNPGFGGTAFEVVAGSHQVTDIAYLGDHGLRDGSGGLISGAGGVLYGAANSGYGATEFGGVYKLTPTGPSTTVLNVDGSAPFAQPLTITATVGPAGAGGSVTFYDGSESIGSAALNAAGVASLSTTTLAMGSHSISARYGGDVYHSASTSSTATVSITRALTSFVIIEYANSATRGQVGTNFEAGVDSVFATGETPTGTVEFFLGSRPVDGVFTSFTSLGTATLNNRGDARIFPSDALNQLDAGEYEVYATYGGDANFAPSSSLAMNRVVNAGVVRSPHSEAFDSRGNLYFSDFDNGVVRRVDKETGAMTVYAGNGNFDDTGDGGPATAAAIADPYGLAFDANDNLYIGAYGNNNVREVIRATGKIITVAGNAGGLAGYGGDGGPAVNATLRNPRTVSVDADGNLYIVDGGNNAIREVLKATGKIVTIAGTGTAGYNGDNIPATQAQFNLISDLTLDAAGNIFLTDANNHRVREIVKATGKIFTVAGNGTSGNGGVGGAATAAQFTLPIGIAVDADGNLFITDATPGVVDEVVKATGNLYTIAGTGNGGGTTDDGAAATLSHLTLPLGLVLDSPGRLFLADSRDNRIQELTPPAFLEILKAPTGLNLDADPTDGPLGGLFTFTAYVGLADQGGIYGFAADAAGLATFYDGNTTLGSAEVVNGVATLVTRLDSVGRRSITARYGGDTNYKPSISPAFDVTVEPNLIVTNTTDNAPGSLRQVISTALSIEDLVAVPLLEIDFAIPDSDPGFDPSTGTWTIRVASALPTITRPVSILGNTQAGFGTNRPVVAIDGALAPTGANGLQLSPTSGGSLIRGLIVDDFSGAGVLVNSSSTVVDTCWIGVAPDGTQAAPNGTGIVVNGRAGTRLGGTEIGGDNDVSNFGVVTFDRGNVISGNLGDGVDFTGSGLANSYIDGNYIGLDPTGTFAIGNGRAGVAFLDGASYNSLGGGLHEQRNVISGNGTRGVYSLSAIGNFVRGNFIGTDATGLVGIGNGPGDDVTIVDSPATTIGDIYPNDGNVIVAALGAGIQVIGHAAGTSAGVLIAGNIIGLGADGSTSVGLGNGDGIAIDSSPATTIGGTTPFARNIISNNTNAGIRVANIERANAVYGTVIQGNLIGTDITGTLALGNAIGIDIEGSTTTRVNNSPSVLVGTNGDGSNDDKEGNLIAGNSYDGIRIIGSSIHGATYTTIAGANFNVIAGNLIGTNFDSSGAPIGGLGNGIDYGDSFGTNGGNGVDIVGGATDNWVGVNPVSSARGENATQRNILSGNVVNGVHLMDGGTTRNVVAGNLLGLDASGTIAVPNYRGVRVEGGASGNRVGTDGGIGSTTLERNVIAGNVRSGVVFDGVGTTNNVIAGNWIGFNVVGGAIIAGLGSIFGVAIADGATGNWVGVNLANPSVEDNALQGNVISGNSLGIEVADFGTNGNVIAGNLLGLDPTGTTAVPNETAVYIVAGASSNRVGTDGNNVTDALERNVIAGNSRTGVFIDGYGTSNNVVAGNWIGTNSIGGESGERHRQPLTGYPITLRRLKMLSHLKDRSTKRRRSMPRCVSPTRPT